MVGDAGENGDVEERSFFAGFEWCPRGDGIEAVVGGNLVGVADEGHLAGGAGLMGEGGIEASGGIDGAVDEGGIVFLNGEAAKLGAEGGIGGGGFCGEDEAGGVGVEAVQEGGKETVIADVGQRGEARDEGVGEGVGFGGAEGMGGLPGGFVEGEEGVVFVENVEGQIGIEEKAKVFGFGEVAAVEDVARGEACAFFGGALVKGDVSARDELFDGGAVEPGEEAEDLAVEALAGAGDGVLLVGDHGRIKNEELRMNNLGGKVFHRLENIFVIFPHNGRNVSTV